MTSKLVKIKVCNFTKTAIKFTVLKFFFTKYERVVDMSKVGTLWMGITGLGHLIFFQGSRRVHSRDESDAMDRRYDSRWRMCKHSSKKPNVFILTMCSFILPQTLKIFHSDNSIKISNQIPKLKRKPTLIRHLYIY